MLLLLLLPEEDKAVGRMVGKVEGVVEKVEGVVDVEVDGVVEGEAVGRMVGKVEGVVENVEVDGVVEGKAVVVFVVVLGCFSDSIDLRVCKEKQVP